MCSFVLFGEQLAEHAEGGRRLQRGAGLGDDIHVKILVAEQLDDVAERVGRQAVAGEEDAGIVLAGDGLEKLDGAAGAEVRAADADDDERLGAAANGFGGIKDGGELRILHALGQAQPAGKVRAETAALAEHLVGALGGGIVGACAGEKAFGTGEIYFNHRVFLLCI